MPGSVATCPDYSMLMKYEYKSLQEGDRFSKLHLMCLNVILTNGKIQHTGQDWKLS